MPQAREPQTFSHAAWRQDMSTLPAGSLQVWGFDKLKQEKMKLEANLE